MKNIKKSMSNICSNCSHHSDDNNLFETCSCGAKLCHQCSYNHIYLGMSEEDKHYKHACIYTILQYGQRGKVAYHDEDDACFIADDPDYEPMKQRLTQLEEENEILKKTIEQYLVEYNCRPIKRTRISY